MLKSNYFSTFAAHFFALMRNILNTVSVIVILLFIWGCGNSSKDGTKLPSDIVNNPSSASDKSVNGVAVIEFEKSMHDFGRIIQGEKVTYTFKFKNTGSGKLIISDVNSSCGCTIPKFTKEPIEPGKSGLLHVTFESDNRKGFQNKTVTVVSNTQPNTTVLKIKAQIVVPERR